MINKFYYIFVIAIIIFSCSKEPQIENSPPVIESIIAEPDSVFPMDTVQLTFTWNDPDNDSIDISWQTTSGSWNQVAENRWKMRWIAPEIPGEYFLGLSIFDTQGLDDEDSIRIVVMDTLGTFIDQRDEREYKWVKIGKQIWMAENLAYLPYINNPHDGSFDKPFYYVAEYYGEDVNEAVESNYYKDYGVFYNSESAKTACPSGWHLPTVLEWNLLFEYLGMDKDEIDQSGGYRHTGSIGLKLKSSSGWYNNCNGENIYGFTAIPAGVVNPRELGNNFVHLGDAAYFRTAFSIPDSMAFSHNIYRCGEGISTWFCDETDGVSIRCIKDE